MSYKFSSRSWENIEQLDARLQRVLVEAIKLKDFTVIEGHRVKERQDAMFRAGKSKLKWPDSKHNSYPSLAVDVAPYPIDWNDFREFDYLAGLIIGIGKQMGITLRWGGDWNRNGQLSDNRFNDLPHLEIVE